MKKSILILCVTLAIVSLAVYGSMSWNNLETDPVELSAKQDIASVTTVTEKNNEGIFSDFIYDVGPRFGPIKKEEVQKATTIDAFIGEKQSEEIVHLKSVSVIIIIDDEQSDIREIGYSQELTEAQLKLLQSASYSTNFLVRAEYQQKNEETNQLEPNYSSPHLTIVPEKQARYVAGKEALMEYLREHSKVSRVNVDPEKLQPAKLFFTVTKIGTIENVRLDRPSGYPSVDQTMIELITKTSGKWNPAENTKGEGVHQELVVSFGLMGC